MGAALEIRNLKKRYGDTAAVDDISLEVQPGEIHGLIGPDGAGKTSTMRICCGLLVGNSGTTQVMGFDSIRQTAEIKHILGYMPQRFSLYPDLSVQENMRFFADLYSVYGEERARLEKRLMQFSRLEPFRSRRAGRLSGGMKQKLALSCTLIHTPKVLILDEPTTGVDPVSRKEFWTILKELAGSGMALLVSTPYMDEAELCHRISLMHKGKIIASGTPDQVAKQFPYRLLELKGEDLPAIQGQLSGVEDLEVLRFGDCLHAICKSDAVCAILEGRSSAGGFQVHPITPTIEDTFVALMSGQEEAA